MTVTDLFTISQLHATWEALYDAMVRCACPGVIDPNALCPHCESLASLAAAAEAASARLWGRGEDETAQEDTL